MTTTASALDPKFAKIIALMNSTEHDGERQACRARAEAVAASCGMTFDEAMKTLRKPAPQSGFSFNFEDHMEAKEPGWKAARAAETSERQRRNLAKRAAVVAKYGSAAAALEPCERERLILAAVAPWRVARKPPYQRWTDNLGGWDRPGCERSTMPPDILAAILTAYPLPTTFEEAKDEHLYWETRNNDLDAVLDEDGLGYGEDALDIAVSVRAEAVRDLAMSEIRLTTIVDLYGRTKLYNDLHSRWEKIEDALFRDLEAMAKAEADLSNVSKATSEPGNPGSSASDHPSASDRGVADMLRADPGRSDRHVARACGCSPTTVGKIRRQLGLSQAVRSVQRRGQMYRMKVAPAGGGSSCTTSP